MISYQLNYPNRLHLIAFALIAVFVVTAALSVRGKSATFDEPWHLSAGISYLQTSDPRLNMDHPPLARIIAALPSLILPMPSISANSPAAWARADLVDTPTGSLSALEDRLWASHLTMLSFSALLGLLIYFWGRELFGETAALLPLALYAFSPPLLANAPIVATDFPITTLMFASVYAWWRYLEGPSIKRLAWTCLAVSFAFVTKFTAALLIPILFVLGLLYFKDGSQKKSARTSAIWSVMGGWLSIMVFTWFVINITYLFDGSFLTPEGLLNRANQLANPYLQKSAAHIASIWPSWLPLPLPFYYSMGFLNLLSSSGKSGFITYFLGEVSTTGSPNYFTMMLLIKLPISTLLLIGVGAMVAFQRLPQGWRNLTFLLFPALFILLVASMGDIQIGVRHILPAIPFFLLLTGYGVAGGVRRWQQVTIVALVISTAWSSISVYPHYLMFFNFLVGGPDQGWRVSTEGDDWGQGGADLLRWLNERNIKTVAFKPLGWSGAVLSRAGISLKPIPCEDTGELVAIHVRRLMRTPTIEEMKCHAWMRLRKPDEKIGYSIFLYNTAKLNAKTAADQRPAPPADLSDFNAALQLQVAGKLDQAIKLYRDYLKREPGYYQARFNLGHALMTAGRCMEAIPEFQRTLELWPGYTETHLHLARCYRELGQEEAARRHEDIYRQGEGKG